jgi:hypothetical protein
MYCFREKKNAVMTVAWITGLLEGDGGIYVSQHKYVSLEITLHHNELQALMKVKKFFGYGKVVPRQQSQSVRYRLHHSTHLKRILPCLAPFFLTQKTFLQYQKACFCLQLPCESLARFVERTQSKPFFADSWLAGFFDAEGHFNLNRRNFQVSLTIGQKDATVLHLLVETFGGAVYKDKSWHGWVYFCSKKEDLAKWWVYFSTWKLLTPKAQELVQIKRLLLFRERNYVKQKHYRPRFLRLVKRLSETRKKRKSTES